MYDLLIKNGLIVDGTGKEAYPADIGITGERIAGIGALDEKKAAAVIDAHGRMVVPGFIEPHSHVDMTVLFHPSAESYLMQGVTTVVAGNCGHAMAPMGDQVYRTAVDADRKMTEKLNPEFFGVLPPMFLEQEKAAPLLKELYGLDLDWHSLEEFMDKCSSLPIDCNIALLAGHSAIRNAVMGMDCRRTASPEEISRMEELMRECMQQGAFGFSTGRDPSYESSVYADDEEIIRLLKIVREYDGIFTSHTANFVNGAFDRMSGYEEFFRQAKASSVKANISHLQLESEGGDRNEAVAEAKKLIRYIEKMESEGVDLTYDVMPVADVSFVMCPYLASVFAPFVRMLGSRQRFAECLAAADFRKMIRVVTESGMLPSADTRHSDGIFGRLSVMECRDAGLTGSLVSDLAKAENRDVLEYAMDLLMRDPDTKCGMSFQSCREAYDILIYHRLAMPCIDNSSSDKDADYSLCPELPEYPAPLYLSSMPCYILNSRFSSLEETIRHMTGMVADRFGIEARGVLKEGNYADIVVIDMNSLNSYENDWAERRYPDGIDYVIVNGKVTVHHLKHTGAAAGRMLRKR